MVERPLDLAAEVGVAGGVDQVDLDALPVDRGGLGEDGDAPLALLVVGVHDSVDHRLVGGEGAGGTQQRVDQRGLAVVDVGDERDVTNVRVLMVPCGDRVCLVGDGPVRAARQR